VDDEKTTLGNLCEAYFYIGEYYLFRNEPATAREYFSKCVKTGITTFSEYQLALWELSRSAE
jgi:lipoprotein NlpI